MVHNWGWWRVPNPESRRYHVKTWHGWTPRITHEQRLRRRHQRRVALGGLFTSKSDTPDEKRMSWVTGGSWGVKLHRISTLSWLLKWTRKWHPDASTLPTNVGLQPAPVDDRTTVRSRDIEMGTTDHPSVSRVNHLQAGEGQTDGSHLDMHEGGSVRYMTGALPDVSEDQGAPRNTVQRRRGNTTGATAWHANSSETSRVSNSDLFCSGRLFCLRALSWDDSRPPSCLRQLCRSYSMRNRKLMTSLTGHSHSIFHARSRIPYPSMG